jgi:hypothetical protein
MATDAFPGLDPKKSPAWAAARKVAGHPVTVCVWAHVDPSSLSGPRLDAVAPFARDLERFDQAARARLAKDIDEPGSAAAQYREHHLETLGAEPIRALFGKDAAEVDTATFASVLRLSNVSLYPEKSQAVFDYSLGSQLTSYVLAITIPAGPGRWRVDMES